MGVEPSPQSMLVGIVRADPAVAHRGCGVRVAERDQVVQRERLPGGHGLRAADVQRGRRGRQRDLQIARWTPPMPIASV